MTAGTLSALVFPDTLVTRRGPCTDETCQYLTKNRQSIFGFANFIKQVALVDNLIFEMVAKAPRQGNITGAL